MSMTADDHALNELLNQQFAAVQHLKDLLDQEHDLLVRRDLKPLLEMTGRKHDLLTELQSMEKNLSSLLENQRLSTDRKGVESLIHKQSRIVRQPLEALWENLQRTAKLCRKQNLINQKVLDASLRQVKQALSILTGQNDQPALYKPSGKTGEDIIRQSFGAA